MPHDLSHAAQQGAFHAALWSSDPPPGLSAPSPEEVALRFKVYRNNVHHSLSRALAARYPVIEQLVGAEFFAALARAFIAAVPPRDPVLLLWGAEFAPFLAAFPPVAHLPFLADVARLEYARARACHAADAQPLPAAALDTPDLGALRMVLHPSLALFRAQMPAVQIWRAHQPGGQRGPLQPGPDHALIARAPDFTVIVAPIDPGTFAVLSALQGGAPLGGAADHADPAPALTLLLRHGLITAIHKGPTP